MKRSLRCHQIIIMWMIRVIRYILMQMLVGIITVMTYVHKLN